MASRKPYECFKCRDNGFPNTMVYLAGKDESGKTVYIEEDGTAHQHKTKQQQSHQPQQTQTTDPIPMLRMMDAKIERILSLLSK